MTSSIRDACVKSSTRVAMFSARSPIIADAQCSNDLPQVSRHQLASRNGSDRSFIDIMLLSIDEIVGGNNASRKCGVTLQQSLYRAHDLLIVGAAHIQNSFASFLQV